MTLHLSVDEIKIRNLVNQKRWKQEHPDNVRRNQKRYNDQKHVKERKLQWGRENRDLINERRRDRYRIKMHSGSE